MQAWRASVEERNNALFTMDAHGKVTTLKLIDLEDPKILIKSQYKFKVTAMNRGNSESSFCWLLIDIKDINDNAPVFSQSSYKFSVSESVQTKTIVGRVTVTDRDRLDEGRLKLQLVFPPGQKTPHPFSIDTNGRIQTNQKLDREKIETFNFQVLAQDSGSPVHTAKAQIQVTVEDENDSTPQFERENFEVVISEGASVGTVITSVKALDADSGLNGRVGYALMNFKDTFKMGVREAVLVFETELDSQSGSISLSRPLDYEKRPEYILQIRAQDSGSRKKEAIARVKIRVKDENDNKPVFNINPILTSIREDARIGAHVAFVHATDKDDPKSSHGRLTYSLISSRLLPFAIDPKSGRLNVVRKMDREQFSRYEFVVNAKDGGGKEANATVIVKVLDVNDSSPKFSQSSYSVKVSEDARPGTPVFHVTAIDPDLGDSLDYRITAGDSNGNFLIQLDPAEEKAQVLLATSLDYSTQKKFALTIEATDLAQHKAKAILNIHIQDKNSYAPAFDKDVYIIRISEDKGPGQVVGKIHATDMDSGENARITYSLANETSDEILRLFSLDSETGLINLNGRLDNEVKKYYNFNVFCFDHGIPRKSDFARVEINVLDVNDNPPVFEKMKIQVNIKENTAIKSIIAQVSASDADEGKNGHVTYSLSRVDPNERGFFDIDKFDGTIRLAKELDREKIACFELEVEARDGGIPSMSAKAAVKVTVEDINDNAPFFPESQKTYFVREDQPVGSIIGPIQAEDFDIGDNANLEYFLIPDLESNQMFYLDSATGDLELMRPLDYEKRQNYSIMVQVFSGSLQTTEELTIAVVDVNDNPPTIHDMTLIFNNFVSKGENERPSLMEDTLGPDTEFPAQGNIGKLNYFEPDRLDDVNFGQEGQQELVKVNQSSGELVIGPNLVANREFSAPIKVWVSDGKHRADATLTVEVKIITPETLANALGVKIPGKSVENFLQNEIKVFRDSVRKMTKVESLTNVVVIDVKKSGKDVEVIFAVRTGPQSRVQTEYFSRDDLQSMVFLHQDTIRPRISSPNDSETCSIEPCENFHVCQSWFDFSRSGVNFVSSKDFVFRRLNLSRRTRCACPKGYAGNLCQTPVNTCWEKPCQNGAECIPIEGGFRCKCPQGTRGEFCQHKEGEGRCEDGAQTCGPAANECLNLLKGGYECKCRSGPGTNRFCDTTTRSFNGNGGYIMFSPIPNRWELTLEMEIRTIDRDALLLHNGRLSQDGDKISVLLRGGKLYVEFSTGTKSYSVFTKREVSTGNWEPIRIQYQHLAKVETGKALKSGNYPAIIGKTKHRRIFVQLGNCHVNSKRENDCSASFTAVDNEPSALDLTGPLFLGGVPTWLKRDSFTGCIRNFHIDGNFIDLTEPLASKNSKIGCPFEPRSCQNGEQICQHSGKCRKFGEKVTCDCPPNFTGKRCETPTYVNAKRLTRGYIRIHSVRNLRRNDDFEIFMQLRTATKTAPILTWADSTLGIEEGHLFFKTGSKTATCSEVNCLASDSEWHQIRIKSAGRKTIIYVDDRLIFTFELKIASPVDDVIIGDKRLYTLIGCISGFKLKNLRSGVSESPSLTPIGTIREGCSSKAKCSPNSCPANSKCTEKWDSVQCTCKPGFFGPKCTRQCDDNPCLNGGKCAQTDQNGGFECECPTEFTGKLCERQNSCPKGWSGSIPGECRPCNCTEELGFANSCLADNVNQCECKENYFRPIDQPWRCVPCGCDRLGANSPTCAASNGACSCKAGVYGRRCDKCSNQFAEVTLDGCEILGSEKCPRSNFAEVQWDRIGYGKTQSASCPTGSTGIATRECTQLGWGKADLSRCLSDQFHELNRFNQALDGFDGDRPVRKRRLTTVKAVALAEHLWLVLQDQSDTDELHGADVKVTYDVILKNLIFQNQQNGYDLSMSSDSLFSRNLLYSSGKLISFETSKWHQIGPNASMNLLNAIAHYAETVASNLPNTHNPGIVAQYPPNGPKSGDFLSFRAVNGTSGHIRPSKDAEVFFDSQRLYRLNPQVKRAAAVFTSRRMGELLPLRFAPEKKGFKIPPHPIINSAIISIALYENYTLLTAIPNSPILIRFALLESVGRSRAQCVFWSKDLDAWSPHGCYVKMENRTHVECSCTHLSTFAVLMDEGEISVIEDNLILKIICLSIISLSILLCLLSVLIFACLSEIRSAQAHLHNSLALSLIALMLIFVLGITATDNEYSCMIVAIGLHYFYLSVFTWCALETVHLYRRLSEPQFQITHRADRQAIQLYYGCGFGLPAVIVATAVGLQPAGYGNARFCWLDVTDPLVGAMVVPIGVLTVTIIAGLIMSLRQYWTIKRKDIIKQEVRKDIRLMALLTPVLFAAWISGLMAVNKNSPVLFVIMAVLHLAPSIFIFLCYIVRSPEVKRAWDLERTKKDRRQAIHNATLVTGGGNHPATTLRFMNNTSSSETSKPYSDRYSTDHAVEIDRRNNHFYSVNHKGAGDENNQLVPTRVDSLSDSDQSDHFTDSEGELLAKKARKANKKLRKQRGPSTDHDGTSMSESEARRTKIRWGDQSLSKTADASQDSLKVVTKPTPEVVVPDVVPDIELEKGNNSKLKPDSGGSDPVEKHRAPDSLSIRRQKSILKNQKLASNQKLAPPSSEDSSKPSGETTTS